MTTKTSRTGLALLVLGAATPWPAPGVPPLLAQTPDAPTVAIVIETTLGDVQVELHADRAPRTVENFLRYVDAGHFDGGQFHRTVHAGNQPNDSVRIDVVQASVSRGSPSFGPIALDRTSETGLRHRDGTLSMARGGPDSATSSFFICIGDQPELDFGGRRNPDGQGFAAFGQVVSGMEVVRAIQLSPANAQQLEPPIRILSVRRLPTPES